MSTGYGWEDLRYVRRCLVRAVYLSASDAAACLPWVRYNKLMFTLPTFTLCHSFVTPIYSSDVLSQYVTLKYDMDMWQATVVAGATQATQ